MQPASIVKTVMVHRLLSLKAAGSKFYGRGTPAVAGVRVNLQHYSGGRWHVVARTKTGRYGWYSFARRPAGTYRAVIFATSAFARGFSPNLRSKHDCGLTARSPSAHRNLVQPYAFSAAFCSASCMSAFFSCSLRLGARLGLLALFGALARLRLALSLQRVCCR